MTAIAFRSADHNALVERVIDLFTAARARAETRARQARVMHELSAMTDRELADIGLSRGQIADVARAA